MNGFHDRRSRHQRPRQGQHRREEDRELDRSGRSWVGAPEKRRRRQCYIPPRHAPAPNRPRPPRPRRRRRRRRGPRRTGRLRRRSRRRRPRKRARRLRRPADHRRLGPARRGRAGRAARLRRSTPAAAARGRRARRSSAARKRHGHLPHMVAMFLGADWDVSKAQIQRDLYRLGPKRVLVLVTPREVGGRGGQRRAEHARHRAERPRRGSSCSTGSATPRKHGRWFAPDGLHLGIGGTAGLARYLKRAVRFAAPGTAPGPKPKPVEPNPDRSRTPRRSRTRARRRRRRELRPRRRRRGARRPAGARRAGPRRRRAASTASARSPSAPARLAGTLAAHGVGRGDVVMTLIGNRPEWVEAMVACFRIGAVALPCTEQLRAKDLALRIDGRPAEADPRRRAQPRRARGRRRRLCPCC